MCKLKKEKQVNNMKKIKELVLKTNPDITEADIIKIYQKPLSEPKYYRLKESGEWAETTANIFIKFVDKKTSELLKRPVIRRAWVEKETGEIMGYCRDCQSRVLPLSYPHTPFVGVNNCRGFFKEYNSFWDERNSEKWDILEVSDCKDYESYWKVKKQGGNS